MARNEKPANESPTERWLVYSKLSHDEDSLRLEGTNMSQSYKSLVFFGTVLDFLLCSAAPTNHTPTNVGMKMLCDSRVPKLNAEKR
jgi:hypothetical protein